jgi:hypothetical protein
VHRGLSLLTAWLRLVYAGILGVALARLVELMTLAGDGLAGTDVLATGAGIPALAHVDAYYAIWGAGLIVFGIHLALLGLLVVRAGYVPTIFGVLLLVAGVGYMAEYGARILWSDFSVPLSSAGWGEPVFMLWLLWAGRPALLRRTERAP